jgi:hypothetical protein
MNSEQRKEYNKKYYETNKDQIKKKLFTKVECDKCNRKVNHQNIKNHQKSSYCQLRAISQQPSDIKLMLEMLKSKLELLEHKTQ